MPDDDKTRLPDDDSHRSSLLTPGQAFGQYKVIRLLGRGGMGEVYEVEHGELGIRHALKLINPEIVDRPDARERFKREARVMARLRHQHIVHVDDFGDLNGRIWLRMELMAGWQHEGKNHQSLQSLIKECAPLPESLVTQLIGQILKGLGEAHDSGAIHRDLKPANILLQPNSLKPNGLQAKITDFGLVSLAGADWLQSQVQLTVARSMAQPVDPDATRLDPSARSTGSPHASSGQVGSQAGTSTQALLGTYAYMSPEQKKGSEVDLRSDLYTVALIGFQLLTGEESLGMETPGELVDGLDPAWDGWIKQGIATRADRRFQSTSQMLEQLPGNSAVQVSPASPAPVELSEEVGAKAILEPDPEKRPEIEVMGPIEPEKDFELTFGESSLTMKWIAPGKFTMGSPEEVKEGGLWGFGGRVIEKGEEGRFDHERKHEVTLTQGYWLGATQVTQALWQALMGSNPSQFKGSDLPVEKVSWEDAISFCRKLTECERAAGRLPGGLSYTLPTEAQWEYACRSGTTGAYAGDLDAMGWYDKNSGGKKHPVGQKRANAWGLYDMHGNVWEWCLDWYGDYPSGSVVDPRGASSGTLRVVRGGSWGYAARYCRSAVRDWNSPGLTWGGLGFRLALSSVP